MLHACGMPPSDADMIHGSGATVGGLLMQASKELLAPARVHVALAGRICWGCAGKQEPCSLPLLSAP